ncbi:hypothetical protein BD289DRAFT_374043 [Coniella lustricola]|uniref:DUF4604 domain-containing protein n=1 Tax=Coniella lustricola TaxID=2025994 RepID=A0A2T3A077_9PEZI|nr:hypothetical protein BD289DRAFT_374043 [Coniella lustricola]
MSQKITGKNLHYDQSLPPFLARLKGQHAAATADAPDPILASHRRAAKKRSASEEAEDAPLVVDDEGNVVAGLKAGPQRGETLTGDGEVGADKEKMGVAAIGASKKRKAGRVIGGGAEDDHDDPDASSSKNEAKKKPVSTGTTDSAKGKKKAKKIKLSFGDDDGA